MKTSESIVEIATALNKAQGDMTGAVRSNANPFYKSLYSDLASIMQAISKPFYDNGLSFVQAAEIQDGMVAITTRIMHKTGEWIESTTVLPATKPDAQGFGSAITYGRRYGLQSLAGIPSVDNDAQFEPASAVEEVEKTTSELIELIEKDDPAIVEVWDELTRDEQTLYHKHLNSKQKSALKALLFKVRDNEGVIT